MTQPCPDRRELLALLDGEVTENRGAELRAHLSTCERCAEAYRGHEQLVADVAAPVPGLPSAGSVDAILRRLDAGPPAEPRRISAWRPWLLAAGGLTAAAALVLVIWPHGSNQQGVFTPRGGHPAWISQVRVEIWSLRPTPRKLLAGDAVAPDTAFVARSRNASSAAAHLLAFAVDARGEVHWLYPAYLDASDDPQALPIAPGPGPVPLPESVVLEDVPPGPLRVITIISRDVLHVSAIERLPPPDRTAEALAARWPAARVDELSLRVDPAHLDDDAAPAGVPSR